MSDETALKFEGTEEEYQKIKAEFEAAVSKPVTGTPYSGGIPVNSRYVKPFTPLKEDEVQLYVDPALNRRFMSEKVATWAEKLGEFVFASGKTVYVRINEQGAYQATSFLGLVYVILREKLRPYFGWLRRKNTNEPKKLKKPLEI